MVIADVQLLTDNMINWVAEKYGESARQRTEQWRDLLQQQVTADYRKLQLVNEFFNQVPYREDYEHWDRKDYWATPLEVLGTNAADCEDYAIAKYFSLRELGVSAEKLRITYVNALEINQAHMVLAYYQTPASIPLILDNLIPDIQKADERKDLKPVYSFNAEGLWLAANRGSGERIGNSGKINLWTELREKMQKELEASSPIKLPNKTPKTTYLNKPIMSQ